MNAFAYRMKNIGKVPICNCRRDRAPIIHGYSFLLCWRCTSILISLLGMRILFEDSAAMVTYVESKAFAVGLLSILLVAPTLIDGLMQYGMKIESNNLRRIITGFIAGFGLFFIKTIVVHVF